MDLLKAALFFLILAGIHTGVMGLTGQDLLGGAFGGGRSLGKRALFILFGVSALYVTLTAFQTTEGFAAKDVLRNVCLKINGTKFNEKTQQCECKDSKKYFAGNACRFCPKGSVKKGNGCDCKKPMFDPKNGKCV